MYMHIYAYSNAVITIKAMSNVYVLNITIQASYKHNILYDILFLWNFAP